MGILCWPLVGDTYHQNEGLCHCLIVGAFAEPEAKPEAEADAYYYGNNGYGAVGSLGYAARPLVSSVGYAARPAVSSYRYAVRPAVSSYSYAARPVLSSYGGHATSPYVSSYSSYGLRSLGKRSADAEPEAEAEADAYYYGNNYGYGTVGSLGYAARPLVSSVGYAARPYSGYSHGSYGLRSAAVGYAARPYSGYSYGTYPSYG